MRRTSALLITGLIALTLAAPAAAITNGTPDGDNHPYIGLAVFDVGGAPSHRCSASLLTPTVVLTAAHCTVGTSAARVWFDEVVQGNLEYPLSGPSSYDGQAFTHPDFCNPCAGGLPGFALHDIGVIVLSEPVPGSVVSEFVQLPSVGAVGDLGQNAILDYVGYGVNQRFVGGGPPVWGGPRVRLAATGQLIAPNRFVHAAQVIKYSLNPAQGKGGTCFGDSGGPDLIGGTDTVVAINSYVTNSNCSGVGYSSRVDVASHLAWISTFLP